MEQDSLYSRTFEDSKNRGALWYIIAFAIIIGLVIWGFLTKQYWMSFVILLISGITYFIENNSEDEISVFIKENGILIANTFYDYTAIDSFSCIYQWEKALFIRLYLNKRGIKILDLKVNETILLDIQTILSKKIKENPQWTLNIWEKIISKLKL